MVNFLVSRPPASNLSKVPPWALVVAASAADKNQRHQPDSQGQGGDDPKNYREPAGEADVRIANAVPKLRDYDHDRDHRSHRNRNPNQGKRGPPRAFANHFAISATLSKSSMNRRISRRRVSS